MIPSRRSARAARGRGARLGPIPHACPIAPRGGIAVGDDSWIEDESGDRAFRVNGKALRIRKTFILEEPGGDEVAKIQERKLSVRDKMEIERGGRSLATSASGWSGSSRSRCASTRWRTRGT